MCEREKKKRERGDKNGQIQRSSIFLYMEIGIRVYGECELYQIN